MSIRCFDSLPKAIKQTLAIAMLPLLIGTMCLYGTDGLAHSPFDSLSAEEISLAVSILKAQGLYSSDDRMVSMISQDPPKSVGWAPKNLASSVRLAEMLVKRGNSFYEGLVDLSQQKVVNWQEHPGIFPAPLEAEYDLAQAAALADGQFISGLTKRGITDLSKVFCKPLMFPAHYTDHGGLNRNVRAVSVICLLDTGDGNYWAHPIEGLSALVNLNDGKVLVVRDQDDGAIPPVPMKRSPLFDSKWHVPDPIAGTLPSKPYHVAEGDISVDGEDIVWRRWHFHLKIDPRVGPIFSGVTFNDGAVDRKVLYEGYTGDMFIPYGDPSRDWYERAYLDASEFNVGKNGVPLRAGYDCPGDAIFRDVVFASDTGDSFKLTNLVCIFEAHNGIDWAHYETLTKQKFTKPKTELTVRFMTSIGNYDYIHEWSFRDDGSVKVGVGATGIVEAKAVAPDHDHGHGHHQDQADLRHGSLIDDELIAPHHQHIYNFRLDLDIDGMDNQFVITRPVLDRPNVEGNRGITTIDRHPKTELAALKWLDPMAIWRITSTNTRNRLGHLTGYRLKTAGNTYPLVDHDWRRQKASYLKAHIYVTPYDPKQKYPAGTFPIWNTGDDGLDAWTKANRSIQNQDLVLWYTSGITHIVRPEEWPIMPTEWVTFEIVPENFFDQNPSLDAH